MTAQDYQALYDEWLKLAMGDSGMDSFDDEDLDSDGNAERNAERVAELKTILETDEGMEWLKDNLSKDQLEEFLEY